MSEPTDPSMIREIFRGLDRMVETAVFGPFRAFGACVKWLRENIGWRKTGIATLLIAAITVVLGTIGWFLWQTHYNIGYWQGANGLGLGAKSSPSEVFRNLGLFLVAIVGLIVGIWRAWTSYEQTRTAQRQADTEEQGQFTSRFTAAVEQLGSEQLPVRLGGVYALWRLAEDSPQRDVVSVFDILCAFVRNPPHPEQSDETFSKDSTSDEVSAELDEIFEDEIRPDVQIIVNLIKREDSKQRSALPKNYRFDFHNSGLVGADFTKSTFMYADFSGSNLLNADFSLSNIRNSIFAESRIERADFRDCELNTVDFSRSQFMRTNFSNSDLTRAVFRKTRMEDCSFVWTDLNNTRFELSDLSGSDFMNSFGDNARFEDAIISKTLWNNCSLNHTNFNGAVVVKANFRNANLRNSSFWKANLSKSIFCNANLSNSGFGRGNCSNVDFNRVKLIEADLKGTCLDNAHMDGADLTNADLTGASIIGTNFDGAKTEGTKWPVGFSPLDDS